MRDFSGWRYCGFNLQAAFGCNWYYDWQTQYLMDMGIALLSCLKLNYLFPELVTHKWLDPVESPVVSNARLRAAGFIPSPEGYMYMRAR